MVPLNLEVWTGAFTLRTFSQARKKGFGSKPAGTCEKKRDF
jgi:hypothetical protein